MSDRNWEEKEVISDPIQGISSFVYVWSIRPTTEVVSSVFSCPDNEYLSWKLTYSNTALKHSLDIRLMSSDRAFLDCYITLSLSVDNNVAISMLNQQLIVFTKEGESCRVIKLLDYLDIPPRGLVRVYLRMKVSGPVKLNIENVEDDSISLTEFHRAKIVARNRDKDLTLIVGGGKIKLPIKVARRSPVLKAMIDTDALCCEFTIPDVSLDVMERVVSFMYTDNVQDIEEVAEQLYPVACMYELVTLKNMCERVMLRSLTVENAAQLLVLADGISQGFKNQVVTFIKEHSGVVATPSFKSMALSHPHLYFEIACAINDVDADEQEAS